MKKHLLLRVFFHANGKRIRTRRAQTASGSLCFPSLAEHKVLALLRARDAKIPPPPLGSGAKKPRAEVYFEHGFCALRQQPSLL